MKTWKTIFRLSVVAVLSAIFVLPMAGSVMVPQAEAFGVVVHSESDSKHLVHCEGDACQHVQERCAFHCLQQPASVPVESVASPVVTKVIALVVPDLLYNDFVVRTSSGPFIEHVHIQTSSRHLSVLRE